MTQGVLSTHSIFCVSCVYDLLNYDIFEGGCTPTGCNLALICLCNQDWNVLWYVKGFKDLC